MMARSPGSNVVTLRKTPRPVNVCNIQSRASHKTFDRSCRPLLALTKDWKILHKWCCPIWIPYTSSIPLLHFPQLHPYQHPNTPGRGTRQTNRQVIRLVHRGMGGSISYGIPSTAAIPCFLKPFFVVVVVSRRKSHVWVAGFPYLFSSSLPPSLFFLHLHPLYITMSRVILSSFSLYFSLSFYVSYCDLSLLQQLVYPMSLRALVGPSLSILSFRLIDAWYFPNWALIKK